MDRINKGFTIIELIVVVSIIGVLATIVLTNASSYKGKAKDVVIKEDMNNFFHLAQEYFDSHGNYGGFCNDNSTQVLFDAIPAYEGKKVKICQHDANKLMVCAKLNFPEDRSKAWCVDASGTKKEISAGDCEQGNDTCP